MMNLLQFYLVKLSEEGSEVAQIALKTAQFGAKECMPEQPLTNFERCHKELNDLLAVVEVLNERFNFGYEPDPFAIVAKRIKMQKYLTYSQELGLVEPNP